MLHKGSQSEIMSTRPIVHITTVHSRTDTRIVLKELASLASCGFRRVMLVVADGKGNQSGDNGVQVFDVGVPVGGRVGRAILGSVRLWKHLRTLGPAIVHLHDPELIPLGVALKGVGYTVIYDIHEDLPRQIMSKGWVPPSMRRPVAWVAKCAEAFAAKTFDAFVPATPAIARRFPEGRSVLVQNFPLLGELTTEGAAAQAVRPLWFGYVGVLSRARGAREIVEAVAQVAGGQDVELHIAGKFSPQALELELAHLEGWSRVRFHGWASRPVVAQLLSQVRAGLVLFHPMPNHVEAQPNKLFEYMSAGLPVIASNFDLWREIIEGCECGIVVDPLAPREIARAMRWVIEHPEEADLMGKRGRQAVLEQYNWHQQARGLIDLYAGIVGYPQEAQSGVQCAEA